MDGLPWCIRSDWRHHYKSLTSRYLIETKGERSIEERPTIAGVIHGNDALFLRTFAYRIGAELSKPPRLQVI